MDPRDLPPMKTGFDNLVTNKVDDKLVENVSIMIMTYADGALRTATTYISKFFNIDDVGALVKKIKAEAQSQQAELERIAMEQM